MYHIGLAYNLIKFKISILIKNDIRYLRNNANFNVSKYLQINKYVCITSAEIICILKLISKIGNKLKKLMYTGIQVPYF